MSQNEEKSDRQLDPVIVTKGRIDRAVALFRLSTDGRGNAWVSIASAAAEAAAGIPLTVSHPETDRTVFENAKRISNFVWVLEAMKKRRNVKGFLSGLPLGLCDFYLNADFRYRYDSLDEQVLEEKNRCYGPRPGMEGLEFSGEAVARHLDSLPPDLRKKEEARIRILQGVRQHICAMMGKMNFGRRELVLSDSRKISGSVLANENGICVFGSERGGKTEKIGWDELPVGEAMKFLEFFAEQRERMEGEEGTVTASSASDAADEYLLLALLSDWHGMNGRTLSCFRAAVALDPRKVIEFEKYLFQ